MCFCFPPLQKNSIHPPKSATGTDLRSTWPGRIFAMDCSQLANSANQSGSPFSAPATMASDSALTMPGCAAGACLQSVPIRNALLVSGFSTSSIGQPRWRLLHNQLMALTARTGACDCHKNSSITIGSIPSSSMCAPAWSSLPCKYILTSSAVVTALCKAGIPASPTTRIALRLRELMICSLEAEAFSARPTPQSNISCTKGSMKRSLSSSLSSGSVPLPGCLREDASTFLLFLPTAVSPVPNSTSSETICGSAKNLALFHAIATARPASEYASSKSV